MRWTVITNCDSFFFTKCDTVYYKLRQVLQSRMNLLQIATGNTKCDDYYKLRQYRRFHRKSRIHRLCSKKFIPKRTRFELQFLCYGGHFSKKKLYAFSRLPSCSSKGRRNMNLKSKTTNGFNFRIINSLMAMNLGREA